MSITKILNNEEMKNEDKLNKVKELISEIREMYGNSEKVIPSIKVNTTHGYLPFEHLEDDSKVSLLINEALSIKAAAIALAEDNPGVAINKKVQELLAINPLFANASAASKFDYL